MSVALDVLPEFVHDLVRPHLDHAWRHPTFTPPRRPTAADAMREKWGKE